MIDEEIQVEIVEVDNKQYKRVKNEDGEFWCLRTIAQYCEARYDNIRKHLRKRSTIFRPFIRSYYLKSENSVGRPNLFLKVPEGLDQLRLYVRTLRDNPEMNKIMSFISQMRTGEVVAATREDVDKIKEAYAKTQHLVLGQDMSYVVSELKEIKDILKERLGPAALVDKELMDPDRVAIINWLLETWCEDTKQPFKKVWWEFSKALGNIQGYSKQPRSLFPDMLNFFFTKSKQLVARAYTWYMQQKNPQEEIRQLFLDILEGDHQKKLDESGYT